MALPVNTGQSGKLDFLGAVLHPRSWNGFTCPTPDTCEALTSFLPLEALNGPLTADSRLCPAPTQFVSLGSRRCLPPNICTNDTFPVDTTPS